MDDLISTLSEIRSDFNCFDTVERKYYEALSEAIKALKSCEDTISRQTAIKELLSLNDQCSSVYYTKCIDDAVYALEILPSAQPENMFEIDKPYPLKGFGFKIWKDAYGNDWVEIRKCQEPRRTGDTG